MRPDNIIILARGAFSAFVTRACGVILTYGLQILLAQWMGVANYGIYAYALAWVLVLAMPCRLGFDVSLLRLLAAYKIQREWGLMRGLLRRSTQLGLAAAATMALLSTAVLVAAQDHLAPALRHTLQIGCWLIPLMVVALLWQAAIQSQRRILAAYVPDQIIRPVCLGLLAWLLFQTTGRLPATWVMAAECAAAALAIAAAGTLLRTVLPAPLRQTPAALQTRQWLKTSLPMILIASLSYILGQTDLVMVGILLDTTQAGIYNAALKTAMLCAFALVSINTIIAPMIATLHTQQQHAELQHLVSTASRWILWTTVPVVVVFIIFGRSILQLFGADFAPGRWPLTILATAQLLNAAAGPVSQLMTMTGHQRACARVLGWSAVVNVLLNGAGIPLFGLNGAAVATAVTMTMQNAWLIVLVARKVHIRSSIVLPKW